LAVHHAIVLAVGLVEIGKYLPKKWMFVDA